MNSESTRQIQYHAATDNSSSSKKKTNYMAMAANSWETGGGWLSERVAGAAIKTSTIPFAFACHVQTQHTNVYVCDADDDDIALAIQMHSAT